MKLYTHELSGHSHRAVLLSALLGLDTEIIPVNLLAAAHKQPEFLARNPFGQVPVLEDSDITLYDSNAILVYLASRYDSSGRWYPNDPESRARIQIWLSKAANELANGPAAARLVTVFGAGFDHDAVIDKAHALLAIVDGQLADRDWLVGDTATIADVALYSYVAHAPEGGVDLSAYANVKGWIRRVENLPGFVAMTATATDAQAALTARAA